MAAMIRNMLRTVRVIFRKSVAVYLAVLVASDIVTRRLLRVTNASHQQYCDAHEAQD